MPDGKGRRPAWKRSAGQDSPQEGQPGHRIPQRSMGGADPPKAKAPAVAPGPRQPPAAARKPKVDAIVTDQADHRRRQIQRLAIIALVRAAYGPSADLTPTPPGPDCCPPTCPFCSGRAA
jgi:hypothetical protein